MVIGLAPAKPQQASDVDEDARSNVFRGKVKRLYESGMQTESELRRQIRSIEDELFDISLLHSFNIDKSIGQLKQLELFIKNEKSKIEMQILVDTTRCIKRKRPLEDFFTAWLSMGCGVRRNEG